MVEVQAAVIAAIIAALLGGSIGFASVAVLSYDSYSKGYEDGLKKGLEYLRKGLERGNSK